MVGIWRSVRVGAAVVILGAVVGSPIASRAVAAGSSPWAIVTTPNTASVDNRLLAVTCTSSTSCWSVGSSDTGPGTTAQRTLAEHWNGSAWSIVATPNTTNAQNVLQAVTCVAASDCWAVGTSYGTIQFQILIEHWNGTVWSISPTSRNGRLSGVTCVGTADCWAIGLSDGILHWNGSAWLVVATPPVFPVQFALTGVTCTGASDCWVVGQTLSTANVGQNLAEHWNGSAWSLDNPPNVASRTNGLYAISCVGPADCWAVGSSSSSVGQAALTEHWDGSAWSIVGTPNAATAGNDLLAVSCLTTSDCWAVGVSVPSQQTLTEHWDGARWSVEPSPNPSTTEVNQLLGVACVSVSDCSAVGDAVGTDTSPSQTLAEHDTTAPTPLIVPGSASIAEGNSGTTPLNVPVTLSNPFPQTVTAHWRTVFVAGGPGNQADPTTDYIPASGTVTFSPGHTSQTVTITVNGGEVVEPGEYIVVQFGSPTNATMGGFWGLGFGGIT
jgi:hypothetical protein